MKNAYNPNFLPCQTQCNIFRLPYFLNDLKITYNPKCSLSIHFAQLSKRVSFIYFIFHISPPGSRNSTIARQNVTRPSLLLLGHPQTPLGSKLPTTASKLPLQNIREKLSTRWTNGHGGQPGRCTKLLPQLFRWTQGVPQGC